MSRIFVGTLSIHMNQVKNSMSGNNVRGKRQLKCLAWAQTSQGKGKAVN